MSIYPLYALRRRYATILGAIAADPHRARELVDDLLHLEAVILMFNPTEDLAGIQPIRPYKARGRRHWCALAVQVLRSANGPMTTLEIAERVADLHGVSPEDKAARQSIESSLHGALNKRDGIDRLPGSPKRWALAIAPA
jgi:hypothetical protein